MNSDLVGVYWLVGFMPIEVIVIVIFFFACVFVYAGREFVEGCPVSFNVSHCSVYGGFALATCIYLAATIIQKHKGGTVPFTDWWTLPFQIIFFILCFLGGTWQARNAKKSGDPQFFVDKVNNYLGVPVYIFVFPTLFLSAFFTGNWTWMQTGMLVCITIFLATLGTDTLTGRLAQRSWLADKSSYVIIPWFKELCAKFSPPKHFGWRRK